MKNNLFLKLSALALIIAGILVIFFSIVGDNGYFHMKALESKLEKQKKDNDQLEEYVDDMNRSVYKLHHDKRFLEKTARNELGLAKDKELIVVFEEDEKIESSK